MPPVWVRRYCWWRGGCSCSPAYKQKWLNAFPVGILGELIFCIDRQRGEPQLALVRQRTWPIIRIRGRMVCQDPLSRSITCCSGQNHKIKYCYFLLCGQLVEKPGCALCSNRVSGIFREGKAEKQEAEVVIPLPCGQFFKFMAANLSFTSFVTWAKPLYRV